MKKNIKFLLYLFTATIILIAVRYVFRDLTEVPWWIRIIEFCFYLSPALAAWGAEKDSFGKFCRLYQLDFKGICWKTTFRYVIATAFLYPLLLVFFIFIGGNILGINALGYLSEPVKNFTYMGINIIDIPYLRGILMWLIMVVFTICYGLTLGSISVWAEEIGWRGFLEKHFQYSFKVKQILTGLIWSIWGIPFFLGLEDKDFIQSLYAWIYFAVFNIALSFYLSRALKQTKSIWASAAIRGVLMSCNLTAIYVTGTHFGYFCITIISIVCLNLLIPRLVKSKN